ncbi:MAG: hypothetical protein IR153_06315 [Flavobacterium sp.]|nr:hypothetical protein [Flavobacterium sp.]
MKNIYILVFGLFMFLPFQEKKERKVLIFNNTTSDVSFKNGCFVFGNQIFKYYSTKKKKRYVEYEEIKNDVTTIKEMNLEINPDKNVANERKPEFYYDELFDIYVFVRDRSQSGYLYPVQRVWVVDKPIHN